VGGELVHVLVRDGLSVRAGLRDKDGRNKEAATELAQRGVEVVELDYAHPETFAPALKGVTAVFYLTVPMGSDSPYETALFTAMKEAGVSRIVKLSVWRAADEGYVFARWHRASEKRIEESGVPWTFLRPSGFMQNLLALSSSVRGAGAIFLPLAQAAVGHIDARDIAEAAAVALRGGHEGKAYDLSGPAALDYHQVAAELSDVAGKPVQYVPISAEKWRADMLGYGMPAGAADGLIDLYNYYVNGGKSPTDPALAELLGRPGRSMKEFIRDHEAAFHAASK
jgi:uncharacterized protein YbjT (DUF2867 family)